MLEALWTVLLVAACLCYNARPQGGLLAASWLWTYAVVWIGHADWLAYVQTVYIDVWVIAISLFFSLRWTPAKWSWAITVGHVLYPVAHGLTWVVWHFTGDWHGVALFVVSRTIFTLQCLLCTWPTWQAYRVWRRRVRNAQRRRRILFSDFLD